MKPRLLLAIVATFTCGFLAEARAEEPAPAPKSTEQTPAPKTGEPTPKPAARREEVEPETLPAASAALKSARAERDQAEQERDAAVAEHAQTKTLLAAALKEAKDAKAALATAQTALATMTKERDAATAALTKSAERIGQLEGLCDVKGVDPAKAVAVVPDEPAEKTMSLASFNALPFAQRSAFIEGGGKLRD